MSSQQVNLYSFQANEPVLLNDSEIFWIVQSGTLAVFATGVKNSLPKEQRRYLFHVNPGEALFSAAFLPEKSQWSFVAIATEPTQLCQMSMVDLVQGIAAVDSQAIELLEGWINHLGQFLNAQQTVLTTALNLVQTSGQNFSLSTGEALHLWQQTLVWVKLQQGNTSWMGVEELTLNPASPAFPFTSAMWLEAENAVIGQVLATADLPSNEEICSSLVCLHTYFFCYLSLLANKQAEAEFQQFQQREQLNQQVIEGALSDLATVLQPEQEAVFSQEGPPLLVAMGAIARTLGIEIRPAADNFSSIQDPVAAIAQSSHIRIRRVTLANGWWRQDQGPMLAYTQLEKRPVALLPTENRDYAIFDPVARTRLPVNEAVAKTLSTSAYVLYRPLPQVALKAIDLLRFGMKGYEKDIVSILVVGLLGTILGMVAPQATAILINHAIPDSDRALLWQIGLVMFAVAFGQLAFQIAQSIITLRVESATDSVLQPAIWDRLLRLSPRFFRQYTAGDLVNRVMAVREIHQKLSGATQRTLLSGVFALFNLVLMFIYSWQLALLGVGLAIFAAVVTTVASFLLVNKSRKQQELNGAIQGLTIQLINGVAKLRVAMAEERAFAAWAKKYSQRIRLKANWQQIKDGMSVFNEALPLVSSILLFGFAMLLMQPRLTLGIFVAFNYALTIFIKGIIDLSNTGSEIWGIVPIWERAKPIWRSQPEDNSTKVNPGQLSGRIALEGVSFRYSENGNLILNNVSLYAEPGEFVAIIGPSGSGKSTIFRLLLGFETPLTGSVYYDGKDLADLELQAVRRQLGVVLQNGKFGTGSIFDNITAGALVSLEQAWEAAQMAGFADDIKQMPMGMHTIIAEGGTNLSGGQRQRLLIARSLVAKPKIILMDEATSALDNRTQAIVTESLAKLNATRVVIAHRLSTIRHADRIYVLDAGNVVQMGNYSNLITQEGLFARLVVRQS
ncbi:MAG: NHLP bacteriocin export ABC transporter permease/ATPase subunit [Nostoc sp. DedVER02]|uniref:NHLP bacteriocin export ABC transporter permease/ATPase subunit n=1 Tax=unclassified Nostoc TaxID=2593658 RepID=UPI002AD40BCA|nr:MULTISPECIES: NHLP bacteriocin export ABC transporter permease/ATPase subunit [unclassified Nostoc]MDZ7988784.1 NHLP bacteriocin export ABC transporter permease/ATPase subunit [Nostoc sp. DedVER02]MDZ8111647.1 NHLP bacteriocin export ABC transporter permease/ATPase subunit [Nostoc sp. DedVER01b]